MHQKGVTYPLGFVASGVACGLKKNGDADLALIVSDTPATCSGVFTRNVVKGHSLQLCQKHVEGKKARAVIINAGNANACVGRQGDADAMKMCQILADQLHCLSKEILPGSTGVIGHPLPMDKVTAGISKAIENLSKEGGHQAARAIMTTDTHPKEAGCEVMLDGKSCRIGAMAKGSGMIHPNMATMISVITTDAIIPEDQAYDLLRRAADLTYNRVSVDGDTSVCDKVVLLANGTSGAKYTDDPDAFFAALVSVCTALSRMLAADGEGATKLLTIKVNGAADEKDAKDIAQAIAKSPLCKTAAFGMDANWGRLLTAAGYSGADFDPMLCDIFIGDLLVCERGTGLAFDEERALEILKEKEVTYTVDLNAGDHCYEMWTCDLSYDYVKINGSYRT